MDSRESHAPLALRGAVYGDIIGAPYMIENTYNRYFDLGEGRRAYSRGRVRSFFPQVTEVSHAASAVARWLTVHRDHPTVEHLQECLREQYERHPRGGWTPQTRLFLTSDSPEASRTPDWAALVRVIPVAAFAPDDLAGVFGLSEACVRATCNNEEAVRMSFAVSECIWMGTRGDVTARQLRFMLENRHGFDFSIPDEDLRSELRGEMRVPVEMLGTPIEGAYRYVPRDEHAEPSARMVALAALKAVTESDSWEDAVRRAVAYGGPSNAVAAIAGGVAECLYGEVTPHIVGKLYAQLPTDICSQLESLQRVGSAPVQRTDSLYGAMARDALTIINLSPGKSIWVVPEDRGDVRRLLRETFPSVNIIVPAQMEKTLSSYRETRQGTYAYGMRPEVRTLYVQDGRSVVSPSRYIAAGMPPMQERRRHLEEFTLLRAWCIEKQKEMNRLAGNPEHCQVHYENACHMWIGGKSIDFMMGDVLEGRISLDSRGLLKVDLGEYRDLSEDARFRGHREQAWASKGLFCVQDCADPLTRMREIREEIPERLFDEGVGSGVAMDEWRSLSEEERSERLPVSNLDRLTRLPEGQEHVVSPESHTVRHDPGEAAASGQSVAVVYSIGYGRGTREAFINKLRMAGVDTVVDVRSFQKSSRTPQFNSDAVMEALEKSGMSYIDGSDKLGNRPADRSLYTVSSRLDWEKVRESEPFRSGIEAIGSLMREGHLVAIAASEADPLSSHRFGLVSRALSERGLAVRHVMPNGEMLSQEQLEDRMIRRYTEQQRLRSAPLGAYGTQREEAYRLMNEDHGQRLARHSGPRYRHI